MSVQAIKNLKAHVEHVLRVFPQTRNSDIELTIQLWKLYFPNSLIQLSNGQMAVPLSFLFDLPREDNVKRCRAKIQNEEKKYLPTDQEVAKQRGINEEEWRQAMGYGSLRKDLV